MKISNSKKQLAKIISENGGWPHEAWWAAQCKSDSTVSFYGGEAPERAGDCWWGSHCDGRDILVDQVLPNWHQTILSRDEYFHLYPAPDADGWIEWKGDEGDGRPVDGSVIVDVEYYDKIKHFGHIACNVNWSLAISYRLHKPEHAEQEYPDGVKPTDPAKKEPTIEQLAADYRAKLAIAQKAQEEADSHRCGAEAALEKLVAAGKALGLVLGVAAPEPEPEPELVITNWRDLRVGDVVEVTGSDNPAWVRLKGAESLVTSIGPHKDDVTFCPRNDDTYWTMSGNTEWRFIRRPAKGGADA